MHECSLLLRHSLLKPSVITLQQFIAPPLLLGSCFQPGPFTPPQSRPKRSDIHLPAGLPEMLVSKLVVVGDHFDESTINECGCKLKRCRFNERQ
jgi:hypothetical protein